MLIFSLGHDGRSLLIPGGRQHKVIEATDTHYVIEIPRAEWIILFAEEGAEQE